MAETKMNVQLLAHTQLSEKANERNGGVLERLAKEDA
ncbi:hypothetical protein BUN12_0100 [Bacillus amyloliquefaciens]|jgi:hypothetical protein|nr:hypothetical protein BUN12_0100 [Bacillus amyloliquefaciens]